MEHVSLTVEGMSCGHCVRAVDQALRSQPGVQVERVEVGSASVRFDPARTDVESIRRALDEAGYPVAGPGAGS